ncbi:methylglutaconyl-CoA hydratase [Rhodococcus sp. 27YEA15]|uniref:enoyl-CoA hydratase/isomerase family protein n=1 Tax=Rhodococcus sp. 27YEA15 TaxID=3156259 RepID=UPI003C79F418
MADLLPGGSGESVRTRLEEGLLTVWLDRPAAAHARNQSMRDELSSLWRAVASDRAVHAVVLTATGERHFCAGMDLKESAQPITAEERIDRLRASRDIELLAALPQPTVAAVNGAAFGGGLEMALACDIRLVAAGALVALPEVTIGIVPGGGGTQRLPRLIGYQRAAELILTGRRLSAVEAVEIGIMLRVVEGQGLLDQAEELGRSIARSPSAAVRRAKELMRRSDEVSLALGTDLEVDALVSLLGTR